MEIEEHLEVSKNLADLPAESNIDL